MLPTLLSQMTAANELDETPKERRRRQIRNRMVYNGWGLYSLVQMLAHKCLRFGKELHIIDERIVIVQMHARHAVVEVGVSLHR